MEDLTRRSALRTPRTRFFGASASAAPAPVAVELDCCCCCCCPCSCWAEEVNGVVVDRLEATSRIFDELSTADEINVAWQTQTGETKFFQGPADDLTGN